jgi:DNA-binding response OmpR family regulator
MVYEGQGTMKVHFDELSLSESPAVTAFSMPGDRAAALGAGFDGYISKPIDPERFVEQIEAYLRPELRARRPPPAR